MGAAKPKNGNLSSSLFYSLLTLRKLSESSSYNVPLLLLPFNVVGEEEAENLIGTRNVKMDIKNIRKTDTYKKLKR